MHLNANGSRQLIGLCNKIFCFISHFSLSVSLSLSRCLMLFFTRFTRGDTRITITINALFSVCAAHNRLMEWKHATCIRKKSCMLRIRYGCQTTVASASASALTATAAESEAKRVVLRLHATPSISQKTVCFDLIKVSTYCYFTCSVPCIG